MKAALKQQTESKPKPTDKEPSQATSAVETEQQDVSETTRSVSTEVDSPSLRQRPVGRESNVTTPIIVRHRQQSSSGGRGLFLLAMFLVLAILGLLIRRLNKLPEQPHLGF